MINSIILFFITFMLYLYTLSPSICVGDSGEFCAAGVILGIPHSPGYPLYCLLIKIITIIIPFGSLALRVNILSAFFGSMTLVVLYNILKLLNTEAKNSLQITAVLLAAVSPAFWQSSIQAEVFTLNTFFAVLIIYAMIKEKDLSASYLFGLGLGNHHTLIFMAPFMAYALWKRQQLFSKKLIYMFLCFIIGFSIYIYLPVRSFKNPALNWGSPQTLYKFWRVISRADYGSLSLTVGEKIPRNIDNTITQVTRFVKSADRQFTFIGLFLGIWGIYVLFKSKQSFYAPAIIVVWIFSGIGFLLLSNMPFNPMSEGIMERFYILTNILWVIPLSAGMVYLFNNIKNSVLTIFAIIVVSIIAGWRFNEINWRQYYTAYDYGRNLLKTLSPGAVFFMDGGDDTFYSLAYLCFAEGRRKDLELHDRGGLVFKNIYGADFRKLSREQKEERRKFVEKQYLNIKPIYFSTFNQDVMPGIKLVADGVLYKPDDSKNLNSFYMYSLRNVYDKEYSDYRTRALLPIYPYFNALLSKDRKQDYWVYDYNRWPDVMWLQSNLRIELSHEAYNKLSAGDVNTAFEIYKLILTWYPDDVLSLVNLGIVEKERKNIDKALECYARAVQLSPAYTDAYYNMAVIYWEQKKWQEAAQLLRKILEINSDDSRAKHFLPIAEQKARESKTKL